jgi:hypothetical protein
MDEDLRNVLTLLVHSFKLLRDYVFSLAEFEDILNAIDDFKRPSWQNELTHIACIEPAIFVFGLCGKDWILKIANKD